MYDGENVVGEFLVCGLSSICFIDDHEFDMICLEDPFQKFKCEPAEPVSVGNHNFVDSSAHSAFQNGLKTFSFPINPRANVCNHEVIRIVVFEKIFLSVEVVHLFSGRDTSVT